jgi:hypothetical protein
MNRWGVEPSEVGGARKILAGRLAGVYTHFASADSDRKTTGLQKECFDAVLADQPLGGVLVHAANSAALLWHPESHYDCVRPGIAVYGLHPRGDEGDPAEEGLRPAMSLKSYVADVRRLLPGEGVSYGLIFRAEVTTFAATVPVGYAEGYRRSLSGKAYALIRGRRRPSSDGSRWTPASSTLTAEWRSGTRSCWSGRRATKKWRRRSSGGLRHDKLRDHDRDQPPARREELHGCSRVLTGRPPPAGRPSLSVST